MTIMWTVTAVSVAAAGVAIAAAVASWRASRRLKAVCARRAMGVGLCKRQDQQPPLKIDNRFGS